MTSLASEPTLVSEPDSRARSDWFFTRPELSGARIEMARVDVCLDVSAIGERRLTAGLDRLGILSLPDHLAIHGPLPWLSREGLEFATEQMRIRGRGGAGFPVVAKLRALPRRGTHAVIVNGSESEPLSAKDRVLMSRAPHLVIDGAVLVAMATGARRVILAVHDETSYLALTRARASRSEPVDVRVEQTGAAFVAGEATAVVQAVAGRRAIPAGRRIRSTQRGLDGRPTFVSNAETFAQLAILARRGPSFADTGIATEPGTGLVTVGGDVARLSVVELPNGIPLSTLMTWTGVADDATILLGGFHGSFVSDPRQVILSRAQQGPHRMGAGVVFALGHRTCPLAEVAAVARWLALESAGQCGPCVFGLPSVASDLALLVGGDHDALPRLRRRLGVLPGRGACAHPTGVSAFVASALGAFADDVAAHASGQGCGRPYAGLLGGGRP